MTSHRRAGRVGNVLSWSGAVIGPGCILVGPILGPRWQLSLVALGVAVVVTAAWWLSQQLADARAERAAAQTAGQLADHLAEHLDALAAEHRAHTAVLKQAVVEAASTIVHELRLVAAGSAAPAPTATGRPGGHDPVPYPPATQGQRSPGDTGPLFARAAEPAPAPGPLDQGWTWPGDTRAAS